MTAYAQVIGDALVWVVCGLVWGAAIGVAIAKRYTKAHVLERLTKIGFFGDCAPMSGPWRKRDEADADFSHYHLQFEYRWEGKFLLLRCKQHREIVFMLDTIEAHNFAFRAGGGDGEPAKGWKLLDHVTPFRPGDKIART
jgi:hypothetical protein